METWKESLFERAFTKRVMWQTNVVPWMEREVYAAYKALFEVIEDLGLEDEFDEFCKMMNRKD